jgi:hypothetical protein
MYDFQQAQIRLANPKPRSHLIWTDSSVSRTPEAECKITIVQCFDSSSDSDSGSDSGPGSLADSLDHDYWLSLMDAKSSGSIDIQKSASCLTYQLCDNQAEYIVVEDGVLLPSSVSQKFP